jgi:disulfide bond formation protein DsbB
LLRARRIALVVPATLLAGAYISQYGFGLFPCEMCWWQRWPHFAAVAFAALGFFVAPQRLWILLAALAILLSGAIGGFHAGVEYGWWDGITPCTTPVSQGGDVMKSILDAPLVRCDVAPWTLAGVSLAGWNFLISTAAGLAVLLLLARK